MSVAKQIQKIIDKLCYNQLYAPDYPDEDRTSLEKEESRLRIWLEQISVSIRREDVGDWLHLGASAITTAFEKFRASEDKEARKQIEEAIQYLRNGVSQKPFKVDFVGKSGGAIIVVPPSVENEE